MAYIGAKPVNGFFSKQDISTDGSTTTFALDFTVSSTSSIIVSVGGVIQEPDTAYTLSGGNTSIVFSEAPASTADTYIQYLGSAIVQTITDINGTELILDVDADTTITADTDDEIDFKIAGSDVITFKATGIHLPDGEKYVAGTGDDLQIYHDGSNSYIANAVGALKLATETSGIAVTIGHSTSEVTIGDNLTVTGDLTIGGTTNFGDFNITNVGSIALDTITNDGTDITLDSSGDIILDAAGNDIFFKAGGTTIGEIENESNNLIIKSSVSDADLILRGNDGGSEISALTFDMSAAGKATFNDQVVIGDGKLVLNATAVTTTAAEINLIDGGTSRGTTAVASGDGILTNDGGTMRMTNVDTFDTYFSATTKTLTNKTLTTPVIATVSSSSNDFTVDSGADIILDADGADIKFKDGGTDILSITNNSTDVDFTVATQDKDINFKGDDGGSGITALSLDMSDAGTAVFNHDIRIADDGQIGSASDADAMTINSSGVVTFSQNPVATLATAAQTNITSLGTLTALTVDDVAIDGKVITMTGSTDDTAVLTVATNGALTLETTDTAAAAANIQITADGTFEVDATTITLDSAGDIVLDAAGNNITLKSGGTSILDFVNSSSDVVIKPMVDAKDIIFQQYDGTSILEINDGAYAKFTAAAVAPEATLTDQSTITWNALTESVAKVTLAGNRTLGSASSGVAGQFISLLVIQDGTGSRGITWNAAYEFKEDTAPTLTTTASKGDLFVFRYNGSKWLEVGRNQNLTLS